MSYYPSSQLSQLFEEPNTIYGDILKIIRNNNLLYFTDVAVQYYMFKYNNTIFIIFNSSLLYSKNKQLVKYKDNSIHIHQGLLKQFQAIEDNICYNINNLNRSKMVKKIYIAGYYMGGGLATIAASILAERFKNMFLVSCFTFGAPMVGNCAFKRYFKELVSTNYRITLTDSVHQNHCGLEFYNCYSYHRYKYNLYNKFYNGNYCHVSNALQLTDNNILELKKPRLTKTDRFLRPFYCNINIEDSIYDIDVYIQRLESIISIYKENLSKQIAALSLTDRKQINGDNATTFNANSSFVFAREPEMQEVPDIPSHSSGSHSSKISSEEGLAQQLCKEDIALLERKINNISNMLTGLIFAIRKNGAALST